MTATAKYRTRMRGNDSCVRLSMWNDKKNRRCAHCGISALRPDGTWVTIECHHINGDYNDNRPENIIPLCKKCHAEIDNAARPDYWEMKDLINEFFDGNDGTSIVSFAKSLGLKPNKASYWLKEYGLMDLVKWHKQYNKLGDDFEVQREDILYPAEL